MNLMNGYLEPGRYCDCCDRRLEDDRGGSGLLLWLRGDDLVAEEPPLCWECSQALGMTWLQRIDEVEDGG